MVIKTTRKKLNKEEINKTITLFRGKLKKEGVAFQKLILFGSYATGNAHIDSDIDVAVVLPFNINNTREKINDVMWWAKQINVKLEPHILSSSDFENRFFSLPAEIKKSGVVF